jgi:uncharacterized protein
VALVCDTGPLYAAMDRSDQDHTACVRLLSTEEALVVPAPVVVEVAWLATRRLDQAAFTTFLTDIEEGAYRVVDPTRADYSRIRELCSQYVDLELGFVDAAVLAVVERLGEHKVATLDQRRFRVVRLRHTPALTLLPEVS